MRGQKQTRAKTSDDDVPSASSARQSERHAEKYKKILDAAAAVFRRKGYAQATLADIARAAGTQAGSLYYYFQGREHLVGEVLAIAMLQTSERVISAVNAMPAGSTVEEKIKVGLREHLSTILQRTDYTGAYERIIDQVPVHVKQKYLALPRAYANFWRELFAEGQGSGEIRSDIDATLLRLQVLGAVTWSLKWFNPALGKSPVEIADHLVEVFLYGALTQTSKSRSK